MRTAAIGSGAGASPPSRRRHVPALDGLRGLAVVAVIAYHLNSSWLPGGYLGVDIFFVISGFLITGLLLDMLVPGARAWPQLRDFWARRARRLLPALVALVVVVGVAASITAPDAVPRLRQDIPAALAFVANWSLLLRHESYFQSMGRPPLLQHLWSLGVEEQFYLAWPWVVLLVARKARRPEHLLCWVAGAGALASAGLMAVLFVPGHDASNVYYDTFTHASGLMIGAGAAAFVRAHSALFGRWKASSRAWAGVGALAGLALLGAFASDSATFTYRGGILLASALTGLVVLVVLRPGPVTRALSLRPLHYLGTRSYSLYLWHWPIICLTRPDVDLPMSGVQLLALRLALIAGASEISYRYVEQPFRTGRAQQALRALRPTGRRWVVGWAGVCAIAVITLLAASNPPPLPSSLAVGSTPAARAVLPGPFGGYTSSGSKARSPHSQPGTQPPGTGPATTGPGTPGSPTTGSPTTGSGSTGPGTAGSGNTVAGGPGMGSTGLDGGPNSPSTAPAGKTGADRTGLSTAGGTTTTAALTSGAGSGGTADGPGTTGHGSSSSGAPRPSLAAHPTGTSTPGEAPGGTEPATPDGIKVQTTTTGESTSTSTSAAQAGASSSTTVGLAGHPGQHRTVDRGSGPTSAVTTASQPANPQPANAQTTTASPGTTTVPGPEATGTVLAGSATTSPVTSSSTAPTGTSVPRTSGQGTSTSTVLGPASATTTTAVASSTTKPTTTKPTTTGPTTTGPTTAGTNPPATKPATTSPDAGAHNARTPTSSSVYLRKHYVLAIGDSVLVAASQALEQRLDNRVTVDAAVGRQVWQGISRLRQYQRVGDLQGLRAVVIDLGTNGPMTPADVAQFRQICKGVPLLVFVNVRVPLPWQSETNSSLAGVAHQHGIKVVNWYGASAAPGVLWPDAVHPDPKGQALYAKLVAQALGM